jgi:hypothetical protein
VAYSGGVESQRSIVLGTEWQLSVLYEISMGYIRRSNLYFVGCTSASSGSRIAGELKIYLMLEGELVR